MQQSLTMFKKQIFLLVMALLVITGSLSAQDLKTPIPVNPDVKIGKLNNGLTYYYRQNNKPEDKVELRLVVNAGSILEDDDQQGLAHFMEHMNFNGTRNFEKNELVSYLQSIGVEFGADLNAYTSFDETVYILPIPTDKEENLEKGFQILSDWAQYALLTDKDIDDERGVVLEESRLGKGAQMRMLQEYLPEMLQGSRYADRLPIGKDDILKNFKYDAVRRFYKDWYRPNLMAVVVVGDIDEATAMSYIKKYFGTLKNPKTERARLIPEVKPRTKPNAMVLTDKEATSHSLQIIFPVEKAEVETNVGHYRESLVRGLMTQIINTRLRDLSQSADPPFPYAYSYVGGWARNYEGLVAFTGFGEEGPDKALMALTAELKRAQQYGFNKGEVERAKKDMLSSIEKTYNERKTTESSRHVGELIRNFLENEPIPGIEKEYEYYNAYIPGISVDELNKEIKDLMSNMNTFSLITGPDASKDKLPSDIELLAMTKKGFSQEVTPLVETEVAASLMAEKPRAGSIEKTENHDDLQSVTYTLSNGIHVTVKNTDFKSDEIIVRGVKKGGSNNYGVSDINNVKYATDVADAMGYGQFPPTELEKVLAGKNIKVSAGIGQITNTVSGSSTVKDLESMLQLMYITLTKPRMDKALFEAYKKKQVMQLQFLSANPTFAFIDTMYTDLYGNNPLAPSPLPKPSHFDDINMERAMEIYRKELSNADGYHFYVVGNVDGKEVLPLIETYIGGLPMVKKEPTFTDNGVRPVKGDKLFKYYKGSDPKSMILSITHGEAPYSEEFSLKVQALAEILNIRVIEELREKLSGIYGGGYNADVEDNPYDNYSLVLQLPCGPENVDKLISAADEVVKEIRTQGPKQEDLDKVKSQWHEKHRENVEKNSYWAGKLMSILFWDRSKAHVLQYDNWIDSLTVNDIKETANKVFGEGDTYTAILYPEAEK